MPVAALAARREFAKSVIDRAVRRTLRSLRGGHRRTFTRLLWNVQGRSEMLRPVRFIGAAEPEPFTRLIAGLAALADRRKSWLRQPEDWSPADTNPLPLFSSLAHHLFASYSVPPVLLNAWFEPPGWHAQLHQVWFILAGMGKSLRSIGTPIKLSRRMAHEFAHAPAEFPVGFALRWAQVRGLGGSDLLARAVAATWLGERFVCDEFWASFIVFLVNHGDFDLDRLHQAIDYLHDQKYVNRRVIIGDDVEVLVSPPQPDLSLRGWTPSSLLRRVEGWKASKDDPPVRRLIRWERSPIGEFRLDDFEGAVWTVRELLDSDALAAEGKAMDHCVANYTDSCCRGRSTIWSIGVEALDGRRRVATVEVIPETRAVVQAKMQGNEDLDPPARAVLDAWARAEGLSPPSED